MCLTICLPIRVLPCTSVGQLYLDELFASSKKVTFHPKRTIGTSIHKDVHTRTQAQLSGNYGQLFSSWRVSKRDNGSSGGREIWG